MISPKQFLVYARAPFTYASLLPMLTGAAFAWRSGLDFNWLNFALTLVGMLFVHFAVNLYNDYFDFVNGVDQTNSFRGKFNGGSGALLGPDVTPRMMAQMATACLLIGIACGIWLMVRVDGGFGPVFVLIIAGIILGVFYTAPPLKLAYRGLGEVAIFFGLGVLPIFGTYYVITGDMSWTPVIGSMPVSLGITWVLWVNEFPDSEGDRAAGKRNLVVRLGTSAARYVYAAFVAACVVFILMSPVLLDMSPFLYLGLLGIIPAFIAMRIIFEHHSHPDKLVRAQAFSIQSHMATALLFAVGVLL